MRLVWSNPRWWQASCSLVSYRVTVLPFTVRVVATLQGGRVHPEGAESFSAAQVPHDRAAWTNVVHETPPGHWPPSSPRHSDAITPASPAAVQPLTPSRR